MSGEVKLWDIRGSDRALETWDAFPGGLAAFDVHEQCGVFAGYGPSRVDLSSRSLGSSQAFCPVILELADSSRRYLFNIAFRCPLYCKHEHGAGDVSDSGLPISIYTTVWLLCLPPDGNVVWGW
jgi:hypothetical protein